MNGAADAEIGAAAADVACESFIDIRIGGRRIFREQGRGGHDHADLAISALRDLIFEPGLLDRVEAILGQAFDGGDADTGGG